MGIDSYKSFSQLLIDPNVVGDFPTEVILHRLNELGFKDIFVNDRIKTYGFPCKYNSPLDEAILMLHYFLTKHALFRLSKLMIHAIHFPSKEEETTLAFWKSPKAGLYLDLQSMIILMNGVNKANSDKKNVIKRLFVFRDNLHLAHLESNGISVILEQQGVGILTGFLIHNNQPQSKLELHRNTLLIEFIHDDDAEQCEWALLMDNVHSANYPYGNNMVSKWYKGRLPSEHTVEVASERFDFDEFFKLFAFYEAQPQTKINTRKYYFERTPEKFRTLLETNFDAALKKRYQGSDWSRVHEGYPPHNSIESPNTGAVGDYKRDFMTSMNVKGVPETLEQFYSALTQIKLSKDVRAIDASSVKSTLKVHETDANYRHWIRASIQLTVKDPRASLARIYILDLSDESEDEYELFKQVLTLYEDFTKNRIAKLETIWPSDEMGFEGNVVMPMPDSKVKVYLITKQAIEEFCDDEAIEQNVKHEFYRLLREDFITTECEEYMIPDEVKVNLPLLDVLYSDRLVYVYKDLRGEPTQAHYAAKLLLPSEVEKDDHGLQTFLTPREFRKKQGVYSDLFDRLQELSIQVFSTEPSPLPNTGSDGLPPIAEVSSRLRDKRLEFTKKSTGQKTESGDQEQPQIPSVGRDLQSSRSVPRVGISSKQVFFVYAEEDRENVQEVHDKLKAEGYEPFMDSDIVPGAMKEAAIKAAMKQSRVRLVFFSSASVAQWGPIQSQYKDALDIGKEAPEGATHLIPVKLDECQLPEEFQSIKDVRVYDPDFWERLQQGLIKAIEPPTELP